MKLYPNLPLLAICAISLTGCVTSSIKPVATEDMQWDGKKPSSPVHMLDLNTSKITFMGSNGHKHGESKIMPFAILQPGEYNFDKKTPEVLFYSGNNGTVDISATSTTAAIYVNKDTFSIISAYPGKLVILGNTNQPTNPEVQEIPQPSPTNAQGPVINPWAKDPKHPYPTIFPNVGPNGIPPIPTGEPAQELKNL